MNTRTIAFANQKGGVGKTTTAVSIAACLAENGKRVLLVDLDPQANATSALGLQKLEGGSVYQSLLGTAPLAASIQPSLVGSVSDFQRLRTGRFPLVSLRPHLARQFEAFQ